ncbi:hypothetical protein [Pseudomonas kribbensis]|uniref:Uncharacterized protein n=1 Tax=Pseudomonas kribbensis TaxID=1628086 RepID=A0A4Y8VER6_9PSED|nr:hypothetical protein [Pseudomonas kribbensis]TFH79526.1 hypothetical protein E4J90_17045 [Pseudomonas kribbensis]
MDYFATHTEVHGSSLLLVSSVIDETQLPTGVAAMYDKSHIVCPENVRPGWYFDPQSGQYFSPEKYEEVKDNYKVPTIEPGSTGIKITIPPYPDPK